MIDSSRRRVVRWVDQEHEKLCNVLRRQLVVVRKMLSGMCCKCIILNGSDLEDRVGLAEFMNHTIQCLQCHCRYNLLSLGGRVSKQLTVVADDDTVILWYMVTNRRESSG